ncbi:MAG: histidinol-phosphatase HisJ family protein [Ruminiclostridium sp.]
MLPFDLHTHTSFSFDGEYGAEEMVFRAYELGIEYYAITDHLEINEYHLPEFRYPEILREAKSVIPDLTEKYSGKIHLIKGIELGQPVHDTALAERLLAEGDYDYIIGSCHMIRGYRDFYFLDYDENDPVRLLDMYFDELIEMAEWGKFDTLAHITYPLRYIVGDKGKAIDMSRYEKQIERLFSLIIEKNIALEINTSGLRQSIGETLPGEDLLRKYYDMGGRLITMGSDAHKPEDIGKGIAEGIALAKKIGFTAVSVYKKRKPILIEI